MFSVFIHMFKDLRGYVYISISKFISHSFYLSLKTGWLQISVEIVRRLECCQHVVIDFKKYEKSSFIMYM